MGSGLTVPADPREHTRDWCRVRDPFTPGWIPISDDCPACDADLAEELWASHARITARKIVLQVLIDHARRGNRHALAELETRAPATAAFIRAHLRVAAEWRAVYRAWLSIPAPTRFRITDAIA